MLIYIADAFDKSLPGRLAQFGEVTEDPARLKDADVVLIRSKTKATKEYLDSAPKMKLIIRGGVGTDNIDKVHAKEKGILVKNTPKASGIAVAELAFAMMIAIPNQLITAHNALALEGKFLKKELKRTELSGKTLALVGMGNIAMELARRAAAFGMKVQGYDPMRKPGTYECVEAKASVKEAFAGADFISLHVPLTDDTKGMINADTIGWMKDGVILVNTARGKCIVENDLVAALQSGKVRGYAADVWTTEPPEPTCPLLKAPNVLMCPHLGASSKENLLRIGNEVVELLTELRNGGKI
jgi:D-3-phosphoglycerate dehydrogenase